MSGHWKTTDEMIALYSELLVHSHNAVLGLIDPLHPKVWIAHNTACCKCNLHLGCGRMEEIDGQTQQQVSDRGRLCSQKRRSASGWGGAAKGVISEEHQEPAVGGELGKAAAAAAAGTGRGWQDGGGHC